MAPEHVLNAAAEAAETELAAGAASGKPGLWEAPPGGELLRQRAHGGVPANPFAEELAAAAKALRQTYRTAYVQHAPLEPRAALAVWEGDRLTVWAGTQNPFGARGELARALGVAVDRVRVIVPDFGGGFGGKHMPDAPIEAARLAKAVAKPVLVRWTREEEFTWAYFRPAAGTDPLDFRLAHLDNPRLRDLPELDIHLLDRPDLASAGGGETPIIAIAPAVGNAVFHATGQRLRQMPMRLA